MWRKTVNLNNAECSIPINSTVKEIASIILMKELESRGFEIIDKKSKEERNDIESNKIDSFYLDVEGDVEIDISDVADECEPYQLLANIDDEDIIDYLENGGYSIIELGQSKNIVQAIDELYSILNLKRHHSKERLLEEINDLLKFHY